MEEVAVGECDILVLSLPVAPLALEGFMVLSSEVLVQAHHDK